MPKFTFGSGKIFEWAIARMRGAPRRLLGLSVGLEDPHGDQHEQHSGNRDHLIGHVVAMTRLFVRALRCGRKGRCGLGVGMHDSFACFGSHLNKCRDEPKVPIFHPFMRRFHTTVE